MEPRSGELEAARRKIKAKWGKLTADDLTAINGRREELEGKIQQRYGLAKDQARKEIDDCYVTRLVTQGFEDDSRSPAVYRAFFLRV